MRVDRLGYAGKLAIGPRGTHGALTCSLRGNDCLPQCQSTTTVDTRKGPPRIAAKENFYTQTLRDRQKARPREALAQKPRVRSSRRSPQSTGYSTRQPRARYNSPDALLPALCPA